MKKILVIAGVLTIMATSCIKDLLCIDGNGIIEEQGRTSPDFRQVENTTVADIVYRTSDEVSITVSAESNLLDHLITETREGKLVIRTEPGSVCFNYIQKPVVTLRSPELNKVKLSGSGSFFGDNLSGDMINLEISGSGDISADFISCQNLDLKISGSGNLDIGEATVVEAAFNISGSGNISIRGTGDKAQMRISGSGDIRSDELPVLTATETISGSGDIYTRVENSLNATISGSGNIYLKGNPEIHQNISGSGKIIHN